MISFREIVYSIYGAWRLARFDRAGMDYFDTSEQGFWRSFSAAALVAPIHILLLMLLGKLGDVGPDALRFTVVEIIAYVLSWTAWPLAVFYLARALDRGQSYFRYVVAYNWAQVVGATAMLVVSVLARGLLPQGMAALASVTIWLAILFYEGFIARTALDVPSSTAAGMVMANVVLGLFIFALANRMLVG